MLVRGLPETDYQVSWLRQSLDIQLDLSCGCHIDVPVQYTRRGLAVLGEFDCEMCHEAAPGCVFEFYKARNLARAFAESEWESYNSKEAS